MWKDADEVEEKESRALVQLEEEANEIGDEERGQQETGQLQKETKKKEINIKVRKKQQ